MARRRKGFQEGFADLAEINQAFGKILRTLPSLEKDVIDDTLDVPAFENLVVELNTMRSWLSRVGVITPTELTAVRFRAAGISDMIYSALTNPRAQNLSSGVRARLAALGKVLLLVSKFRG